MPIVNEEVLKEMKELVKKIKERSLLPRIDRIHIVPFKSIELSADITEEEAKDLLKKGFELVALEAKDKGSLWVKKYNWDWEKGMLIDEEQIGWVPELSDLPMEIYEKKKRELEKLV